MTTASHVVVATSAALAYLICVFRAPSYLMVAAAFVLGAAFGSSVGELVR